MRNCETHPLILKIKNILNKEKQFFKENTYAFWKILLEGACE